MSWNVIISLVSEDVLVENLTAINETYSVYEPIEVIKDFENYQLPKKAQKITFIGDSDIALICNDIDHVSFNKL